MYFCLLPNTDHLLVPQLTDSVVITKDLCLGTLGCRPSRGPSEVTREGDAPSTAARGAAPGRLTSVGALPLDLVTSALRVLLLTGPLPTAQPRARGVAPCTQETEAEPGPRAGGACPGPRLTWRRLRSFSLRTVRDSRAAAPGDATCSGAGRGL